MESLAEQLEFRTSSYSDRVNCVEVADTPGATAVRDSQHRKLGHLEFPTSEWTAFVSGLHSDRF
ncbi:hypothetical protein LP52_17495 [Streptomonospora alba]|uniref:DUF397 domain-containing protein n=1 Tax=Streptomonospora alba TaxID=183763 RepID=A0A0C2JLX4_9ACTN|nr:hypothetical protein LP52_17495 [Streptomonospora alba]